MDIKVFKRVEKKYLINEEQYQQILNLCGPRLNEDYYFKSCICNIYFDTINDYLIVNSLEKPPYKEKVRLRCYGVPKQNDKVFLEIKKKYNGVVNKRRVVMTLNEFYNYYEKNIMPIDNQIMREIDYCFKKYNLVSKRFLAYDRYSYYAKDNMNFRLTFDYNIRSRTDNLRLELGSHGVKLLDDGLYIMEVKCLGAMPLWFVRVLSELKIYPISFSKYGEVYTKERRS